MDSNFNNENDQWEFSLDIDDSDIRLTPVLHFSSSTSVEPSSLTPNPVRIIPGPAVNDVGEDEDFNSGVWVSTTNYVIANGDTVTGCLGDIDNFLKNGKLEQVVVIVKSCSLNVIGDQTLTIKDLPGVAMILVNVFVFTPKPSMHYLNITKKNVVKVFRKDTAAILKTFGGNEATKKTKKNLLKQQYGNFRAEGAEMLEQTFTRLQVIVGQLQFMGVEVEQDDLNQKFLTSLAPEWLMHTIVWRNKSDCDTMSLDDLYNHLKVYEAEVQKKSKPNTQNIAFISSTKHSRGNDEVNTASVYTASANVPTVSISQETGCAYIASQSGESQIKFEDINQINEDDMEEMDIK
nr:hypothetical protein [Tanacetum cinerariifolium]